MNRFVKNIERIPGKNADVSHVLYTAKNCQLVVMALKSKEEIGAEVHELDQVFRVEEGTGEAVLGGVRTAISAGFAVLVPAGGEPQYRQHRQCSYEALYAVCAAESPRRHRLPYPRRRRGPNRPEPLTSVGGHPSGIPLPRFPVALEPTDEWIRSLGCTSSCSAEPREPSRPGRRRWVCGPGHGAATPLRHTAPPERHPGLRARTRRTRDRTREARIRSYPDRSSGHRCRRDFHGQRLEVSRRPQRGSDAGDRVPRLSLSCRG